MSQNVFGKLLDRLVHERFRSAARFSAALRDAGADVSESKISRIIAGEQPPQLDEIAAWLDVLRLKDEEAREFQIEAELAKLRQLEELKDSQASACEARIDELSAVVEKLSGELQELRIRFDTLRGLPRPARRT